MRNSVGGELHRLTVPKHPVAIHVDDEIGASERARRVGALR